MSRSEISEIACSHEIRTHSPPSFFMGYLSRRSPRLISRIAAPLAQWVPWLIGLSNDGSWPSHAPFSTSAHMEHPTEQNWQMVLW